MSSGGSSSWALPTQWPSPGPRGAATAVAAPRSRSAGRGSRLSVVAAEPARPQMGGRPRAVLPSQPHRDRRRSSSEGVIEAVRCIGRARRRRPARRRGLDRRARRAERLGEDDASSARRPGSSRSTPGSIVVAGAPAGSRAGSCAIGARAGRARGVRRADAAPSSSLSPRRSGGPMSWRRVRSDALAHAFGLEGRLGSEGRDALARPAAAGERCRCALARNAARARRRGDGDARPGGGRRPRRGACALVRREEPALCLRRRTSTSPAASVTRSSCCTAA